MYQIVSNIFETGEWPKNITEVTIIPLTLLWLAGHICSTYKESFQVRIAHSIIRTWLFRGKMLSDWFNGMEILQGRWQHGEKVGCCYPSVLEKTLCKWNIYVPLVTKGLRRITTYYNASHFTLPSTSFYPSWLIHSTVKVVDVGVAVDANWRIFIPKARSLHSIIQKVFFVCNNRITCQAVQTDVA